MAKSNKNHNKIIVSRSQIVTKNSRLKISRAKRSKWLMLLVTLVIGCGGSYFVFAGHAQTPSFCTTNGYDFYNGSCVSTQCYENASIAWQPTDTTRIARGGYCSEIPSYSGKHMIFQFTGDGNLTLSDYNTFGKHTVLWSSGTGSRGYYLHGRGDGSLVVENNDNLAIWSNGVHITSNHLYTLGWIKLSSGKWSINEFKCPTSGKCTSIWKVTY